MPDETDLWRPQRERMVTEQIAGRGIRDPFVLEAMRKVPRHVFVPPAFQENAYEDRPLPLGPEQTISQPYIVALMLEELHLKPNDRVLEIGTGSGYQSAVLAEIVSSVYSLEIDELLSQNARETLRAVGYFNVLVKCSDGYSGWPQKAPFDAIILSACSQTIPRELVRQLKPGGRMLLPFGEDQQVLLVLDKTREGIVSHELGGVKFVRMKSPH